MDRDREANEAERIAKSFAEFAKVRPTNDETLSLQNEIEDALRDYATTIRAECAEALTSRADYLEKVYRNLKEQRCIEIIEHTAIELREQAARIEALNLAPAHDELIRADVEDGARVMETDNEN